MLGRTDTDPKVTAWRDAQLRSMSPQAKLERVAALIRFGQALLRAEIQSRRPDASASALDDLVRERTLGPELARRVAAHARMVT
jgi:hypothetical protein